MRETHIIGDRTREWIVQRDQCPALDQVGISWAGVSEADAHFSFVRNDPNYAQVLACFAGEGLVWVGGQWKPCGAGSGYVFPAQVMSAYHAVAGAPWGVCWVIYPGGPKCPVTATEPALIRLDPRPLHDAILGLYRESVGQAEAAFFEVWADILQLHVGRVLRTTMHEDILWPIGNAVSADLRRPWSVDEMAAIAGISGEHLRRLCRQQLGCSPMQQVTRLRMRHAGALLQATPQKIDTIAQMVGYTSRFSFSAAFKRCLGVTPGQYRAQGTAQTIPVRAVNREPSARG